MKVSVLLATKDRPEKLAIAVDLVLGQKHDHDVEIIVKDGGLVPAVGLPDDPRIVYVYGPDDSIANAFNQAAIVATGDIMHNANDDDLMRPGTIASAVEALAAPGAMWTYGCLLYETEDADGHRHRHAEAQPPWPWDPSMMMRQNCVHQPTVFYRREAWDELGPFNETFRYAYDYEFWGRLGSRYEPVVRNHYDATYTFWEGSTSVSTPELVQADADAIAAMWRRYGFGNRP